MRRAMPPEKYWMRESVKVPQESRRKGLSQRMFSVPGRPDSDVFKSAEKMALAALPPAEQIASGLRTF